MWKDWAASSRARSSRRRAPTRSRRLPRSEPQGATLNRGAREGTTAISLDGGGTASGGAQNAARIGSTIFVRITDLCPACASGQFDLNPMAFSRLVDIALDDLTIIDDVDWHEFHGPYTTNVEVENGGSNSPFFVGLIVHDHNERIDRVEIDDGQQGGWLELTRVVNTSEFQGRIPSPPLALSYPVRITSVGGEQIVGTDVILRFLRGGSGSTLAGPSPRSRQSRSARSWAAGSGRSARWWVRGASMHLVVRKSAVELPRYRSG